MTTGTVLELLGVSRHYQMGSETIRALHDVSFSIAAGEYVGIVGSSGSGKSTLLNILGCLDTPTAGAYRLRGTDVLAAYCCGEGTGGEVLDRTEGRSEDHKRGGRCAQNR